ncbi:4-hydroxy-tetrahydrodipicolinate reductase [Oceanobacillus profundus]|uniref:4-hydroxy-tetrahydrodipicolinate reductase n=1 Tax=Oceanobacillus profundus TaxID=372463 RepID=A0A417YFR9_9BACI|nr:4-hydroxy-tetrahydrodipicolinate reductase [Oceanobacillus profundus]MBR3120799.1 4-hydroxy-tetrahydrodipicolinate reductase [Oceanobacillus sp.]PAE29777.1 4-hydroxy-tetrahydrodipicolinate reductase [Paenibacillus sp. 7884-2]MCM3396645.1 4-hydroxy-tetrahydrodipicolinate reductase [Oceanobacillus profundus]MDO6450739.1 4-hydroxy-tetrahydrodipicolinate reductase [Oceanobacillus profundus]RHW31601.1 4-hydroxy-tetrahydrodipicolinate reductase [Oceanobacillus profundus]
MTINIILAGPRGRMGQEAVNMVNQESDFKLVACIDRKNGGKEVKDIAGLPPLHVPVYENAKECFEAVKADVFIDLTVPEVGYYHTKLALENNIRPVVGTTGFTDEQLNELAELAKSSNLGCIIAPNFAVGAVLMMKFSQMAAKYFSDVEIIEKHHDRKLDAPSGTAKKTAELIRQSREYKKQGHPDEEETIRGARGAEMDGMHIHSVRLPGLVAHQEVIFGSPGQTLSIKHDSLNRESFMDGIKLSVNHVMDMKELAYGLENIL